jgi:hypothetical protein
MNPDARQKQARKASLEILEALRVACEKARVKPSDLDRELKRGKGYHSHLFSGKIAFSVEHLAGILSALGSTPGEFFRDLSGGWVNEETEYFRQLEAFVDSRIEKVLRGEPGPKRRGQT